MDMKTGRNLFGFTVKEIRYSDELHGRTVLLEHDQTGAGVFWVDNASENIVFSIAFRIRVGFCPGSCGIGTGLNDDLR